MSKITKKAKNRNSKPVKKKRKKAKKKSKLFKNILSSILLLFLSFTIFVGSFIFFTTNFRLKDIYADANIKIKNISNDTFMQNMPTIIYDCNNNIIEKLAYYNYEYLPYDEINPKIFDSFIAIEDKNYFNHNGIDKLSIIRAGIEYIKNKGVITQGGSTITQQLVKNTLLSHEQTFKRKFEEIIISLELEKKYSKKQILEYYVNNIYFGNNSYGIETASLNYFNKSSKDLTLGQIAFLVAIPNNPTMYDPLTKIHNTLKRQKLILSKMLKLNFISEKQYIDACKENVELNTRKNKIYTEDNYMISYALDCTIKELMFLNGFKFQTNFKTLDERTNYFNEFDKLYLEFNSKIRKGGYNIHTSFEVNKQQLLQSTLDNYLLPYNELTNDGIHKIQGAAITIENSSGNVISIVGGRSSDLNLNSFNRAYLSYRQPGSTIKPLVAYTPAFEKGYTPFSIMNDEYIPNGPKNADSTYRGNVTLEYATEISLNTIPFSLVRDLGPEIVVNYLHKMNFKYLYPNDINPIIAVGGFTKGVTPEEMAGAYSTLARNGEYIKTSCVNLIESSSGRKLYENNHIAEVIYTPTATQYMTNVLKGVLNKPNGTAYGYSLSSVPSAGKTGTTDNNKDLWFCGYSPYYTTVIYVGSDIPDTLNIEGNLPSKIWKDYMDKLHIGLPYKNFN